MNDSDHVVAMETVSVEEIMALIEGFADARVDQWADRQPPAAPPYEVLDANDKAVEEERRKIRSIISEFLASRLAKQTQDGWVLVPKEPVPEMLGAWYRYKNGHHWANEPAPTDTSDYGAYRAMLAAAPSPVGGSVS